MLHRTILGDERRQSHGQCHRGRHAESAMTTGGIRPRRSVEAARACGAAEASVLRYRMTTESPHSIRTGRGAGKGRRVGIPLHAEKNPDSGVRGGNCQRHQPRTDASVQAGRAGAAQRRTGVAERSMRALSRGAAARLRATPSSVTGRDPTVPPQTSARPGNSPRFIEDVEAERGVQPATGGRR